MKYRALPFAIVLTLLLITQASAATGNCQTQRCVFLPLIGTGGSPGQAPDPSPSATTATTTPVGTSTTTTPVGTSTTTTPVTPVGTSTTTTPVTPVGTSTTTPSASPTPVTPTPVTPTPTAEPVVVSASDSGSTPIYNTFEVTLTASPVTGNKFTKFASLVFTSTTSTRAFTVEAFYDGGTIWRARFMPETQGRWFYRWSFEGSSGAGSFNATPKANALAHGHVKVSASDSRDLVYDDGKAHYWYGSKWFHAANYGPAEKFNPATGQIEINQHPAEPWNDRLDDDEILKFLDDVKAHQLNGILLKIGLQPLENDKLSWDLPWIQRGDFIVREAAKRGIYVQVNFFNAWSRSPEIYFDGVETGTLQLFNVWASDGDDAAKQNYVRSIVARFSGYYNVYWELGNEMARKPNDGDAFEALAKQNYIPWIRQYDPYHLPIGLSESNIADGFKGVDIVFAHRGWQFPSTGSKQAWIANELNASWTYGKILSRNREVRDAQNRLGYRRAFWRQFASGSNGTSMSSWLLISTWLTDSVQSRQPVYTVMDDIGRLRSFIEGLPVSYNQLDGQPVGSFVISATGDLSQTVEDIRTRAQPGKVYVSYFLVESDPPNASNPTNMPSTITTDSVINKQLGPGQVTVQLPSGNYRYRWYDPKKGYVTNWANIAGGGPITLGRPAMVEDLVLLVTRK